MTRAQVKTLIDTNLEDFSNITPDLHRAVSYLFLKAYPFPGELKSVMMDTLDIPTYFDTSGLGREDKEYEGWAIRNGNNGTDNAGGLVDIGYDNVKYPVLGGHGGSEDAVLVAHSHTVTAYLGTSSVVPNTGSGPNGENSTLTTSTAGESGVGKNMQPYRVVLKLMSL